MIVGGVDERSAIAPLLDQPCAIEVGKVKGQRRRRNAQFLRNCAGRQAFGPCLDEQTREREAVILSKRAQGFDGCG